MVEVRQDPAPEETEPVAIAVPAETEPLSLNMLQRIGIAAVAGASTLGLMYAQARGWFPLT